MNAPPTSKRPFDYTVTEGRPEPRKRIADISPFNHRAYDGDGPYPSWFWYGRYEGAVGGYIPPQVPGTWPQVLYWIGNFIGRHFGPPNSL